jgi:DNA repair exonuclease SbcCD ATPase subunit|tara:strand:+ start:57 stop:653 length:597 start_codon:yes stop_codon:yes gene_type:complete
MKPIRSNELEFWVNYIRDEFNDKRESIETEISMEAQKIADKKKQSFPKVCGIEKDLKNLEQATKKYDAFVSSKQETESKLLSEKEVIAQKIGVKLNRISKARGWKWPNGNTVRLDDTAKKDIEWFNSQLDEVCYQEAKRHVQKNHTLYNQMNDLQKNCKVIVHTGGDINSTVRTLKNQMKKADINLTVPQELLQIACK